MRSKVSIIILNWNGWKDTLECLKSLENNNYSNYRVVVVDNGSTDDSLDKLQDIESDRVSLISLEANWGFSGGNNFGVKRALENETDYVLLLNNDTVVEKNFLSELVKEAEKNPKAGLFGPKIYYYNDKNRIWFAGGRISVNPLEVSGTHIGLNKIDKGQYDKVKKVDYITGCCLLIKKGVIKKVGFLDEDYFLYYEDADYGWRAKKAGYNCLFVPKAKIWHKCSAGTIEGSSSYIYYHTRNALMMVQKNGSFFERILVLKLTFWIFLKQIFKLAFIPSKRTWAKAVLTGLDDYHFKRTGKYENWH